MEDINFDCPHCNQNLDAPNDMAGETIECPACEEPISIPVPDMPTQAQVKKRMIVKPRSQPLRPAQLANTGSKRTFAPIADSSISEDDVSEKSRIVALLLCFFLGGLSVHRFYVGKIGTGVVQILTLGGLGVWVLIDFIMIIMGSFTDKNGLAIKNW